MEYCQKEKAIEIVDWLVFHSCDEVNLEVVSVDRGSHTYKQMWMNSNLYLGGSAWSK